MRPRALSFSRTDRGPRKELWNGDNVGMNRRAEMNKYLAPGSKGSVCIHKIALVNRSTAAADIHYIKEKRRLSTDHILACERHGDV